MRFPSVLRPRTLSTSDGDPAAAYGVPEGPPVALKCMHPHLAAEPIGRGQVRNDRVGNGRCRFRVWAPRAEQVEVEIQGPQSRFLSLEPSGDGYFAAEAQGAGPGDFYLIHLDGNEGRPDPASRFQPEGVHGPSMVIDRSFAWTDADWQGLPLPAFVFYEIHVGTFTPDGTFEAVIPHLDRLRDLGITAQQIGTSVRVAYQGATVAKWAEASGKERDVRVTLPAEVRNMLLD